MICPHCGNETSDESLQCEHCGKALSTGVNWGVRKSSNIYRPQYSSDTEKITSFVAATPTLHKTKPQGLKIAAGIAAIAFVVAVGWMGFSAAKNALGGGFPPSFFAVLSLLRKKYPPITTI